MKRKYPVSFFFLGVLQNFVRYFVIGLIGLVFLVIGVSGVHICKIIGTIVLVCYLLLCVAMQFFIRFTILKKSNNPEFDKFMNDAFGVNNHSENALSSHERIIKMIEDKIKSHNADLDN